VRGQQVVFL
jgi:hypothetical protein